MIKVFNHLGERRRREYGVHPGRRRAVGAWTALRGRSSSVRKFTADAGCFRAERRISTMFSSAAENHVYLKKKDTNEETDFFTCTNFTH